MKLSTKGRYAVHALVDIAHHSGLENADSSKYPVSLVDISDRHAISRSYLEQLFVKLRKVGLVTSVRGQSGGYHLARSPYDISIAEIIDAVDEPIKTTKCNPNSKFSCQGKTARCLTHNLWLDMENSLRSYLANISIADVILQNSNQDSEASEKTMESSYYIHAQLQGIDSRDTAIGPSPQDSPVNSPVSSPVNGGVAL